MFASTYVLLPLLLASYVSAHGFVHQIAVNGRTFTGAQPGGQRNNRESVIRQIRTAEPVKGANNAAVNCGPGAFRASTVAEVQPGDTLSFDWRGADLSLWPHNTGPMINYLASCGDTPCNEFDASRARWFKIDQQGQKPNSAEWVQADLMKGGKATTKIPENIAPGNYLIRHEIIALHLASNQGGAEFYPSCAQLKIGGNGNGRPAESDLISLPGAYSDNEPGILVRNAFQRNLDYKFPGGPIARLSGSGNAPAPTGTDDAPAEATPTEGSGNGGKDDEDKPATGDKPTTGNSGNSKPPTKVCKIKKKNANKSARAVEATAGAEVYPRHISRVMRRLAFDTSFQGAHAGSA
jgi:hypothetical protein